MNKKRNVHFTKMKIPVHENYLNNKYLVTNSLINK